MRSGINRKKAQRERKGVGDRTMDASASTVSAMILSVSGTTSSEPLYAGMATCVGDVGKLVSSPIRFPDATSGQVKLHAVLWVCDCGTSCQRGEGARTVLVFEGECDLWPRDLRKLILHDESRTLVVSRRLRH
jgi:hypothetical protein